ncbi:sigma-54-dependent Fis family transcriptional regulator [Balneolaceae bacterium YR4-1]|uniref:Sigma-54-dependent Fis family transcriptional regulator n=1 Tax=Halalkalibaculum roseum TaxID=2709311 RepID=A0A6M1T6W8_9BACT|nr:sigma-54 dependent transcriptional regulator [Halalkalibaculum roseum]NGP77695.1 sigma-54-dependent Fis family transcriptional regulator [Halalkalibaculum roseum]
MTKEKSGRVLVVDDDTDVLQAAKLFLKQHVAKVDTEKNPSSIPNLLKNYDYDLVLLDMNFTEDVSSGKEGFHWLKTILEIDPSLAVVLITAYGDVEKAVKAVKLGATDFVLKPWQNEKLLATVHSALNLTESRREVETLKTRQKQLSADIDQHYQDIIGKSPAMNKVFETIEKVAKTDANILITGENGTGKELVARALHRRSNRSDEVFISVDLGAIPENLFESELFGHTRGAFTDAKESRAGRFEVASGGTLFLDEIGNLPLQLQPKLLSAIETRKVTRVGSNKPVEVDIRLICATNEPIQEMVHNNEFRQDLLYRINTIEIHLPALRDRTVDIPLLANHFLKQYSRKYDKDIHKISDPALNKLQSYKWPGNVRELQHAVERAVIMTDHSVLQPEDFLLTSLHGEDSTMVFHDYNLEEVEKTVIRKALDKHEGNISKSADELGLTRASLYRRMEKYDL